MSHELDRRRLLTVLAVGTAAALAGCARTLGPTNGGPLAGPHPVPAPAVPVAATRNTKPLVPASSTPSPTADGATSSAVGSTPLPLPGFPEVVDRLPLYALPGAVALTIDDGFNPATVAAYVEFARASGVHLTFNPNGLYSHVWAPHAETLRPLIEAGQVQIGNHTYGHKNITKLSRRKLTSELESNDEWIQQTFGITSRPWFRPPFGFHNARTDSIAGELGYTKILMWNGSFGDSALLTPEMLLKQAHLWLRPGTIMLGHANHPVITHLFPQLLELIKSRELTPQTLDEAFGTSRALG